MMYQSKLDLLYKNNLDNSPDIIRGAMNCDIEEIRAALIENPDCINNVDPKLGMTALAIAGFDGQYSIVDFLCDQPGIDIGIQDKFGRPAWAAGSEVGREDIVDRIFRDIDKRIKDEAALEDIEIANQNVTIFRPKGP